MANCESDLQAFDNATIHQVFVDDFVDIFLVRKTSVYQVSSG